MDEGESGDGMRMGTGELTEGTEPVVAGQRSCSSKTMGHKFVLTRAVLLIRRIIRHLSFPSVLLLAEQVS